MQNFIGDLIMCLSKEMFYVEEGKDKLRVNEVNDCNIFLPYVMYILRVHLDSRASYC